jgi:hypothetical protein
MATSYCWGDRNIPYPVLKKTDNYATVEINGQPHNISIAKVRGWCEWSYRKGDRVRVLMGYNWHVGTVGEGLSVALDDGLACPIWSANNVRTLYVPPIEPAYSFGTSKFPADNKAETIIESVPQPIISVVPLPLLEDYEEDEMSLAKQYDLLEPLNVGDRVRIVLAGSPLEHLTGLSGTVDGAETFGIIPVLVDENGLKILRREQLDLIEPDEEGGTGETPESVELRIGAPLYPSRYSDLIQEFVREHKRYAA